ncbi:MAG: ATPase, T2SS/T4P/T4SS family [Stagnimonas sp.]|nr:ATPase, T2SS/T4P/T4SS family [Stagnimonas sp.]
MNTSLATDPSFHWPKPPFFDAVAEPAAGHSGDCSVEMLNGRLLKGKLSRAPNAITPAALTLSLDDPAEVVDVGQVRWIKLAAPVSLVRNQEAMRGIGVGAAAVADRKDFVVSFRDGTQMKGATRGFVRNHHGLFLYLIQDADDSKTTACYIPAAQLKDVNIGPPLGQALEHQSAVSGKALAAALNRQAELRTERLGEYLANRAILTPSELTRALEQQRQRPSVKLGEFLVQEKLITPEQLQQALSAQQQNRQRRLGDILVESGVVSKRQIQLALSDKLGIPFVDARQFVIEPSTLRLVPDAFAAAHQVLPLLRFGDSLVVAVENPLTMDYVKELQFVAGLSIVPTIANTEDLRRRISLEYGAGLVHEAWPRAGADDSDEAETPVEKLNITELASELAKDVRPAGRPVARRARQAEARVMDNVLVRLVNKIIVEAHAQGASDIHIESNPRTLNTHVRFRKDGDLDDYLELLPTFRNTLVSRIKVMAGLDISEHRHAQDGKIEFGRFGPLAIELRVAIIPTANGLEDVVMRILGGVEPLPIESLGLHDNDLAALKQMVTRNHGLLLVCGPTGSGKTTTLHSVLHHINRPDMKIWTAEDPIEITQPGLRQVQINAKIGWTFAEAMRAFLRADPDVIMVGEMRDVETAKMGIEASLTGHLVLSTLHTNSAAESVVRLLDLGMDPFNFADSLVGILSQRLARKLCGVCKKAHPATETEIAELAQEYCAGSLLKPAVIAQQWRHQAPGGSPLLYEAAGCPACKGGYRGRMGIYELLPGTTKVKHLVRSRGTVPQLVEAALEGGMQLLKQDAINKVLSGTLDLATARAASS